MRWWEERQVEAFPGESSRQKYKKEQALKLGCAAAGMEGRWQVRDTLRGTEAGSTQPGVRPPVCRRINHIQAEPLTHVVVHSGHI